MRTAKGSHPSSLSLSGFAGSYALSVFSISQPMDNRDLIVWPEQESEFEVQAELYYELKLAGFDYPNAYVRGCVTARCTDGTKRPRVFLDLVVFNSDFQAVAIIECKNFSGVFKPCHWIGMGARQSRRYAKFGIPVIVCRNSSEILSVIKKIKEILPTHDDQQPNPNIAQPVH